MKAYHRVLSIAGSDSSGGAGIQADIKTISACGCYVVTAITALTAQNTQSTIDIFSVSTEHIKHQIESFLYDIGADAIKIGMLHNSEVIKIVSETLKQFNPKNLDPVMVSTSGHHLLEPDSVKNLINNIIPLANIITPNIPEAELLLKTKIDTKDDLSLYAKNLAHQFNTSVFLKAGHQDKEELVDVFYNLKTQNTLKLYSTKIKTQNTHMVQVGCTLSSAIASFLAKGESMEQSVKLAKNYINKAIINGTDYQIGQGHGPVLHFFEYWK